MQKCRALKRLGIFVSIIAVVLLLFSTNSVVPQPVTAADEEIANLTPTELPAKGNPKLDTTLDRLASGVMAIGTAPLVLDYGAETLGDSVRVIVESAPGKAEAISRLISELRQDELPEWIRSAIQAARLAPSAINRQPWGFDMQDGSITVYVRTGGREFSVSKRLDCGIAMLHIEVAAMSCGVGGDWQFLKVPQVARFSALM